MDEILNLHNLVGKIELRLERVKDVDINLTGITTPCYLVDERRMKENLEILQSVMEQTGCEILLAQKAFSMYEIYPTIGRYLSGTTASSLYEARLGYEEMGKEVHIFAPAYRDDEFEEILKYCDHIVFNSYQQWMKYRDKVMSYSKERSCGLRINPEYSEVEVDLYNPCFANSRFGIRIDQLEGKDLTGIEGLHFHTMCEQGADVLERTLVKVEEKFGHILSRMKWINFGGGHHITKEGYDLEKLVNSINRIKDTYEMEVYLEPGEAIAYNGGYLISKVLEIMENGMELAIMDTSASCHMPDVIEMPYRPHIIGSGQPGDLPYTYRLGGPTCLSGDVIGDYSFPKPLEVGDLLIFTDMAIYSMVKNNTFNGVRLPSILLYTEEFGIKVVREFGYEDFKHRLS